MKISYNWLKQYVAHDLTPRALAEALTMSGLEVEGVESQGTSLEGVVVGEVLEARPHPNADRLTLCQVNLGNEAPVQIVCGAPNVAAGQKVPVATVGTTLLLPSRKNPSVREPFTIKKAKLRGEASHGMICAEDELGLSEDHSGIMVLDEAAEVGRPFPAYLEARGIPVEDAVLDVSITPNRPDATSHLGVARDVSALTDLLMAPPEVVLPEAGQEAAEQTQVDIQAPAACGRYVALLVRGVEIKESPAWLKQCLTAVGLRPRNNVVDVTNFVMYECGQPLHAFDYDQLSGGRIVVREAAADEPFTTLDGQAHTLPEGALLICDAEQPVAVAGVMGGENSEVTEQTTNVLIESAYFDPSSIRRTAKALNLQTDASYRFERGVDPEGQVWAAARAAALMAELGGGAVVPGMVDAHPRPVERREVRLRRARIQQLLGVDVPVEEVMRLLRAIGFEVAEEDPLDVLAEQALEGRALDVPSEERSLRCVVPSFRPDIEREVDVIEEIARIYGFDRIPEPARMAQPSGTWRAQPAGVLRSRTRARLGSLGFREIYTNSMLPRETADLFCEPVLTRGQADDAVVETLNPISQEMAALRPSLLPGLLQVMSYNQNHGQQTLQFFEFGHVFLRTGRPAAFVPGYAEREVCIMALSGQQVTPGWDTEARSADFYDVKGVVEALLEGLRIPDVVMAPVHEATPVTAYHLTLHAGEVHLGLVARLAAAVEERFGLKTPVYFAELNWQVLVALAAPRLQPEYVPVSRFPVVERDLAVVLERAQPVGPVVEAIRAEGVPLLQHVAVFDLYQGEHLADDKKSAAFALRFGAARTLKDEEVDARIEAITRRLHETFGARLRQ